MMGMWGYDVDMRVPWGRMEIAGKLGNIRKVPDEFLGIPTTFPGNIRK